MAWHKNNEPNAAAGHYLSEDGAGMKWDIDCPKCKTGTLLNHSDDVLVMICIDCREIFQKIDLLNSGKLHCVR